MAAQLRGKAQYLENLVVRGIIGAVLMLPYRTRVRTMGWIMAQIVAPLVGWRKRVRNNWSMIMPDMLPETAKRLARQVPNNFGRALVETYSADEFIERVRHTPFQGAGVSALQEAKETGRPVVLAGAHFGNYLSALAAMKAQGYHFGALYAPMENGYANDHYLDALRKFAPHLFERSRNGLGGMLKFVKSGGMLAIFTDLHVREGEPIDFLGRPAYTSLTAAEMALKYDALLIPFYGKRHADGIGFDVIFNAPVQHSTALQMTKDVTADLEKMVRETPEQWFWIHRRWKNPPWD